MNWEKKILYVSVSSFILCVILWVAANYVRVKAIKDKEGPAPQASAASWGEGGDPVAFKKPEEVLELLGEPDARQELDDRIVWFYLRDRDGWKGGPLCVEIHFMEGEVKSSIHYPCWMMPDKISTANLVPRPRKVFPRTQRFTLEEFNSLVMGKTRAEIQASVGEAEDLQVVEGKEIWRYREVVLTADGKLHDEAVQFEGETVSQVQGN